MCKKRIRILIHNAVQIKRRPQWWYTEVNYLIKYNNWNVTIKYF